VSSKSRKPQTSTTHEEADELDKDLKGECHEKGQLSEAPPPKKKYKSGKKKVVMRA
jgi:hypothetical protein